MANSRDVRLTIRARDEASKVIAKVAQALGQYANGTDDVGRALTPLRGKLDSAVKSVSQLQTTMAKTAGQIGVNRNYQIIADSLAKMTQELADNRSALTTNSDQLLRSKAAIESSRQSRDALRQSISDEKKALTETSRAIATHTRVMASAEEQSRDLTAEIQKRESALAKSRADLEKSTQAQRDAEAADQRAIRTTDVLVDRISQLRAAREAERRALTGATGMTSRSERVGRIAATTDDPWAKMAARSFQEDEGAVRARLVAYDREIQRVETLRDAAKRAQQDSSRNLAQQVQATREISRQMVSIDNLGTLRTKLAQAQAQIAEHSQKLGVASVAHDRLTASISKNEHALSEKNAEIQIAQSEIQKLDSENRALSNSIDRGTSSIEKSTAALNDLQSAAKSQGFGAIGQSVDDLEKRLARLTARYNQTADVLSRAARYSDGGGGFTGSEDAAKLRKLNDELRRAQDDSATFKKEINELNAAISRGDGGRAKLKADIRALAQAMGAAENDARQLTMKIREVGVASGSLRANVFDVWRKHNQDGRTALNLYQRIRGQVLSLIAAYAGLYGVARGIQSVSEAFMTQEAAISRLGVVFDGNQSRMGVELDWIRRQAQRLGIEFGVLSQEYTKFAVGAAASGFSDDSIRTIFLSVAEAGRVNKLSLEDLQGTFLALSQMIGKSKISAEELRQQLGERLPGAVRIVADALGLTISELDDLMKKGKVFSTEENMLKIAAELDRVFGQQLPNSLRSFTAEWGRLQNTMFQSRVLIGRGGMIDAMTDAMQRLNEFANTKEGVEFFLAIGAAMGEVIEFVPTLIENFESIVKVLKLVMTIGIAAVFRRWMLALAPLGLALGSTLLTLARAPSAFMLFNTALWSSATAMGAAGVAARGLGAALLTLGPLAAALIIGSQVIGLFSSWSDGVDQIVQAQAQHERIMDRILQQYEDAKGKTYDWVKALNSRDTLELREQYDVDVSAFENAIAELDKIRGGSDMADGFWSELWHSFNEGSERGSNVVVSTARDLAQQFGVPDDVATKLQKDWQKVMYDLNAASRDEIMELISSLRTFSQMIPDGDARTKLANIERALQTVVDTGENVSVISDVLQRLGFTMADAESITSRFSMTIEEAADGVNGTSEQLENFKDQVETQLILPLEKALEEAGAFEEGFTDLDKVIKSPFDGGEVSIREMLTALDALKNKVPEIAAAFKALADDGSIDALSQALSWMNNIPGLGGVFKNVIGGEYGSRVPDDLKDSERFGKWAESGLGWMIRAYEDYRGKAYADQKETGGFSAWRVGYGSDTVTDANTGAVRRVQQNETIDRADAEADLMRRINTYMSDIVGKIGQQRWDSFGDEQREVLLSLAHNYGTIPDRIMNVVKTGTASEIAAAIRGEIRPGSVNNARRGEEAAIFERGGAASSEPYQDAIEERAKIAEKEAEEARKAAEARADEYKSLDQSLDVARLRANEQEREAFIVERINQFREQHGEISAEELANLREQYGVLYDMQNQKTQDEQRQEKIKEHQERINQLETERNALIEQREFYQGNGNTDKVEEINGQLTGINSQLETAIDNFIAFWKATGGPEAAGAIAQLEATRLQLRETGKEALLTAEQINQKWASGLSDAFSEMAKAIANGENAWESFRDAFLSFASEFLIEIGKMIVQQALLNALQGSGGSGGFGGMIMKGLSAITGGVFHSGKGPGQRVGNMSRRVDPAVFNNAQRFHSGKLPGLRQGEMAAIIEADEEVIPTSDPRHAWNTSGEKSQSGSADGGMTIINAIDAEQLLEAALKTDSGKRMFVNQIKLIAPQIKQALS